MEVHAYGGRIFQKSPSFMGFFLLKVLKIVLEIQYPSSLPPYQRSKNLSQAMHIPVEGGLERTQRTLFGFQLLVPVLLKHRHISSILYQKDQSYFLSKKKE